MYLTLAIFVCLVTIGVAGAAVYTVWYVRQQAKGYQAIRANKSALDLTAPYLLRWTVLDYAGMLLSFMGLMFVLVDLIAVIRERDSYPYYHYGYLACGFVFLLVSVVFLLLRLGFILALINKNRASSSNQSREPQDTK